MRTPDAKTETADPACGEQPAAPRRCDQCGRPVRGTVHGRGSYTVDCFVLHTGETEPAVIRRPDSDEAILLYQRLTRPVVLLTCADCYADPARRRRHQSWAYPAE